MDKYKDKRLVMYKNIPEYELYVDKAEDQDQQHTWWPVGVIVFKPPNRFFVSASSFLLSE